VTKSNVVLIDNHPGRSAQTIGIARELGADPDLIHEPSVGVVGTKGDSQCYLGVMAKVDLACGPHRVVSLMSREAADELGLRPGVAATAVIKATTVVVER
jgi:molybdopterin-binding protein